MPSFDDDNEDADTLLVDEQKWVEKCFPSLKYIFKFSVLWLFQLILWYITHGLLNWRMIKVVLKYENGCRHIQWYNDLSQNVTGQFLISKVQSILHSVIPFLSMVFKVYLVKLLQKEIFKS